MSLHARRLSYDAGAREGPLNDFADLIRQEGIRSRAKAFTRYSEWKKSLEKSEKSGND